MPKTSEIKVRPASREKQLFELGAALSKRSLNQWMIVAGLEKAERDGVKLDRAERKGGR